MKNKPLKLGSDELEFEVKFSQINDLQNAICI